jgi:outer membrane protein OmpA-like peptidoglycan-associated protein
MYRLRLSFLAAALAALPAAAHDDHERHFPAERLEPAVDREGIINTSWAAVPQHLDWDVALWFAYANDPLFTYNITPNGSPIDRASPLVEHRLSSHLTASLALFDWLQVGAELPLALAQSRNDALAPAGDQAPITATGIGDIRLYPKVRILQSRSGHLFDLGFQVPVSLPTGQSTDYFGEQAFTATPTVLASREWKLADGRLRAAGNLGLRLRSEDARLPDGQNVATTELQFRAGAGYVVELVPEQLTELALAVASANEVGGFAEQIPVRNPVEVLGEVDHAVWGPLSVFVGGASGVIAGEGGPDFRVFGGVRWSPRAPLDRDGDGIVNDDDKCPGEPEVKNDFEDDDGCPDNDDKDSDGVRDRDDKCPEQPEDKDGFEDDDGCVDDDHDHDGLPNATDKCPDQAEDKDLFEDDDGCADNDNDADGIADAADKCPIAAEDKDGFADDDGCADADNDADGVADAADKCPDQAGPKENKGCPDADRDGDTVVDRLDNCPDEKGTVENAGCAAKQLVAIKADKIEILDKVFFQTGKDIIEKKSFKLLDNVAQVLAAHPELKRIRVEGHTDNVGVPAKNKDLSDRRAKAVVAYLVGKGLAADRLAAQGFGDEKPLADNATADGKAQNRRVEFVIVDE